MTEYNQGQQALIDAPLDEKVVGVAGAGTGKTTTILARTRRILNEFSSGQILLITFTRMAANDMRERLYRQINEDDRRRVMIGTFHSIIGQLIRRQAPAVGLSPSFSIVNESSTIIMYQSVLEQHNDMMDEFKEKVIGPPDHPFNKKHKKLLKRDFNNLAGAISTMVNGATPEELVTGKFSEPTKRRLRKLITKLPMDDDMINLIYQTFKLSLEISHNTNTVNYDQILFIGYLMTKAGLLKAFSKSIVHMIVDEYQDTNELQDTFVRSVGQNHLTLVGDVDQAIYEFRGGKSDLLVRHANEARIINLTTNYRSYQPILDIANTEIANNQTGASIRKPLIAHRELDNNYDGIVITHAINDRNESEAIIERIKFLIKHGTNPSDIAILIRSRMALASINLALQKSKIAVNDTTKFADFMKSDVMRDTLNFIKVFTNPKDIYAFIGVLDRPKRNIGAKALQTLEHNAATHAMSVVEYLMSEHIETELKPALKRHVKEFIQIYEDLLDPAHKKMEFPEMVKYLIDKSGYREWTEGLKNHDKYKRNLDILSGMVDDFTDNYKKQHQDFTLFDIANAFTFEMSSSIKQEDNQGVTIATIHGAKGLEWSHVFVLGMEQENFPGTKMQDHDDLESERRLMYVAITRAKDGLWLCYSKHRLTSGTDDLTKSQFLHEIDDGLPTRTL